MFITLKQAQTGTAIIVNLGSVVTIEPSPQGGSVLFGPIGELRGLMYVDETPAQIMAEIGRLERQRFTPGESVTERAATVDDAVLQQKAELAAQKAIDAYADTIEVDFVPEFRRDAVAWRDIITDAAYTALGMD